MGRRPLVPNDRGRQHEQRTTEALWEVFTMRQPSIWIAVALMLTGAVMLVFGGGAAGLWIGVVTVGIVVVAIEFFRNRQADHHP